MYFSQCVGVLSSLLDRIRYSQQAREAACARCLHSPSHLSEFRGLGQQTPTIIVGNFVPATT